MLLMGVMSPLSVVIAQEAIPEQGTEVDSPVATTSAVADVMGEQTVEEKKPEPKEQVPDDGVIDENTESLEQSFETAAVISESDDSLLPQKGAITLCKVVLDTTGNVVRGDAGSAFDIGIDFNSPVHFSTPLSLNADLFAGIGEEGGADAQCSTYTNLNLNGLQTAYHYEPEVITGGSWEAPIYSDKYNDMPTLELSDLSDFKEFNGTEDGADGEISLYKIPFLNSRTLVIINQMKAAPEPENAVTISAQKVVCMDEAELPNWNGGADITATTATDWVASHPSCLPPAPVAISMG